eukprot:1642749-Rhodomonas_salina.2
MSLQRSVRALSVVLGIHHAVTVRATRSLAAKGHVRVRHGPSPSADLGRAHPESKDKKTHSWYKLYAGCAFLCLISQSRLPHSDGCLAESVL